MFATSTDKNVQSNLEKTYGSTLMKTIICMIFIDSVNLTIYIKVCRLRI